MQLNTLCMYYTWIPVQGGGGFIIYFKYLTPLPYKLCNSIYHECIICDPGGGVGSVINLSPLCMQNRYPVSYATTQYKGVHHTTYQLRSRGNIRCFSTIYVKQVSCLVCNLPSIRWGEIQDIRFNILLTMQPYVTIERRVYSYVLDLNILCSMQPPHILGNQQV